MRKLTQQSHMSRLHFYAELQEKGKNSLTNILHIMTGLLYF